MSFSSPTDGRYSCIKEELSSSPGSAIKLSKAAKSVLMDTSKRMRTAVESSDQSIPQS